MGCWSILQQPSKLLGQSGFQPVYVGALSPECALLTGLSSGIEGVAIQTTITGDPVVIYRAICHDPLTASVLSLEEIRRMTNDLFAQPKDYLPNIKINKV